MTRSSSIPYFIFALLGASTASAANSEANRAFCEGRSSGAAASERELACTEILAEPNLSASAKAMTLVHRAWARGIMGSRVAAMADYNAADAAFPNSHVVLNERALLKLRQGNIDGALADYSAAIRAKPGEAYPLYGRGLVWRRKGQPAKAEADFRAARIAAPDVDAVFSKLGLADKAK
jgi:tetratricopeptide (TPR) repeat protein